MKIILVEDSENSIANAMTQLGEHEIKVARSILEFRDLLETVIKPGDPWKAPAWLPEAIVTDVNIPNGTTKRLGNAFKPETIAPAGLVIALMAVKFGIPCYVITDSNSHVDPLGWCLDEMVNHRNQFGPSYVEYGEIEPRDRRLQSSTRPQMLKGGKDYGQVSHWLKKISGTE